MEKETIVPQMGKEMNFFDLCVAFGRLIGRGCKVCGQVLARMTRLTYRYWWIVLAVVALGLAAALYYTRKGNTIYKVNAVAMVNAGSLQQFDQAFAPLFSGETLPKGSAIDGFWHRHKVYRFETFRVIDCLDNGTADFIDLKHKVKATDTVNVIMQDRICIQFRIKQRDLDSLPEIEQAILEFLNANDALQQSFVGYKENLRAEMEFDRRQALKLDSLTTQYYFHRHMRNENLDKMQQGTVVMSTWGGDWGVDLFLEDIYEQREHLQLTDYRYQLATAPVVLENHFTVNPKSVNGRRKFCVIFLLLGWIGGCVLAELVDKRKVISAWLKQ